jgi:adenosylhomocysteinase
VARTVDHEAARIDAYFGHLTATLGPSVSGVAVVCVAHVLPNTDRFLPAIARVARIAALLPKPKSARGHSLASLEERFGVPVHELSRDWAGDAEQVVEMLTNHTAPGEGIVLVDIGGYFSPSLEALHHILGDRLIGVMEGTENGAQAYERVYKNRNRAPSVPIVTVARSPLKLPEDHLVGASIVFSVEALLREQSQILQTRSSLVIGFGRVGRAVASALRGRGIPTIINDISPIARAEAAAQGYRVYSDLFEGLRESDLVISATSSPVLNAQALAAIRNGAAVATVTSRDTEVDEAVLNAHYVKSRVGSSSSRIVRYDEIGADRYFWLLNDGNAPNFLHDAVLGPAIQLVEGEKLAAIRALASGDLSKRRLSAQLPLMELRKEARESVASVWNEHFISV